MAYPNTPLAMAENEKSLKNMLSYVHRQKPQDCCGRVTPEEKDCYSMFKKKQNRLEKEITKKSVQGCIMEMKIFCLYVSFSHFTNFRPIFCVIKAIFVDDFQKLRFLITTQNIKTICGWRIKLGFLSAKHLCFPTAFAINLS